LPPEAAHDPEEETGKNARPTTGRNACATWEDTPAAPKETGKNACATGEPYCPVFPRTSRRKPSRKRP
jgi:hypothetical protein